MIEKTEQMKSLNLSTKTNLLQLDWWSNDARKYSLDEIFTYGKGNDVSMVRKTMNYYA